MIDKQGFDMIKKGMAQQEVEKVLGCPPGDYGTLFVEGKAPPPLSEKTGWDDDLREDTNWVHWSSDNGVIAVRKRLLLALGLLACLLAAGVAVLWLTGPAHRIHRQGWAEIKKGMTEQEVARLLRIPPGNYLSDKKQVSGPQCYQTHRDLDTTSTDVWEEGAQVERIHTWNGNAGLILVCFDDQGKAIAAGYFPRRQESFADKLRRWLGVPWW